MEGPSLSRITACVAAALLPAAWWLNGMLPEGEAGGAHAAPAYSLAELNRLSSSDKNGLLIAVWGRVFNVTAGEEFYAVGKTYSVFVGHDCSRAFALTSTKAKLLDRDLEGLSEAKLKHLNETYWETYIRKYPVVGRLTDPPYDPTDYDHFAGPYAEIRAATPGAGQAAEGAQGATTGGGAGVPRRVSKCPVTRAARALGGAIASLLPQQLLS